MTPEECAKQVVQKYYDKTGDPVHVPSLESIVAQAIQEERQRCAKLVCLHCRKGIPFHGAYIYAHFINGHIVTCYADHIFAGIEV